MLEKNDSWKMMELFFKNPSYSYHLRELCRLLGWSPTKVRMLLDNIKKHGLLKEVREKNLSIFKLNYENENCKKYKVLYNLMNAMEIGKYLESELGFFEAIIFFGSASKGEDMEKSDFDVCIVGRKEVEVDLKNYEKKINRNISLLFIKSLEELKEKSPELLNNLINGIVLKGYFKVF